MGFGFTKNDVPRDDNYGDFQPLPEGKYKVIISKMDEKKTKSGGTGWNTTYQVVDGKYRNRLMFDFINTVCPSSTKAEAIGRRRVADIAEATGHADIPDPSSLLNKPFDVEVVVKPDDYNGGTKNEVKKIYKKAVAQAPEPVIPGKVVAENVPIEDDDIPF